MTGSRADVAPPVLVEVTRGDRVESRHRGAIVVCSPAGEVLTAVGDPETFVYLRSAAKPFQLAPFVASGHAASLGLGARELAVMAASHSGEEQHTRLVASLLARAGRDAGALGCGVHPPYDSDSADALVRARQHPVALHHNCSGKHAGMVLFAHASGWLIERYWEPDHPVQRAIRASISAATGVDADALATATDGCGVPTFGVPLRALATAFARLAAAPATPIADPALVAPLAEIRDAMMSHPELVAGSRRRLDTALMRAASGRVVAKAGAEGVQGVGVLRAAGGAPSGVAVVIEDGDGGRRAGAVATSAALHQLGILDDDALRDLAQFAAPAIRDPRDVVSGEIRAAFRLEATATADVSSVD